jgi:hypothetical protein
LDAKTGNGGENFIGKIAAMQAHTKPANEKLLASCLEVNRGSQAPSG